MRNYLQEREGARQGLKGGARQGLKGGARQGLKGGARQGLKRRVYNGKSTALTIVTQFFTMASYGF